MCVNYCKINQWKGDVKYCIMGPIQRAGIPLNLTYIRFFLGPIHLYLFFGFPHTYTVSHRKKYQCHPWALKLTYFTLQRAKWAFQWLIDFFHWFHDLHRFLRSLEIFMRIYLTGSLQCFLKMLQPILALLTQNMQPF